MLKIECELSDSEADEIRELIRDAVSRQHPGAVKVWKAIEKAWREDHAKVMRQIRSGAGFPAPTN